MHRRKNRWSRKNTKFQCSLVRLKIDKVLVPPCSSPLYSGLLIANSPVAFICKICDTEYRIYGKIGKGTKSAFRTFYYLIRNK
jgi:hypothetical protein